MALRREGGKRSDKRISGFLLRKYIYILVITDNSGEPALGIGVAYYFPGIPNEQFL